MEVHRQQCQKCLGIELRNIVVREPAAPTAIYVRCAKCGELVARYELSDYYHHGKGIESFLRSKRTTVEDSGRRMLREFDRARTKAEEGYEQVLQELQRQGKEV